MTLFNFPNLPTDNLYKFYSLSGIFIIVFVLTTMTLILIKIQDEVDVINKSIDFMKIEAGFLQEDIKVRELKISELKNSLGEYGSLTDLIDSILIKELQFRESDVRMQTDPGYRDYLEFKYKHIKRIIPEIDKYEKIEKLDKEILKSQRQLKLKKSEIKSNFTSTGRKINQLRKFSLIGALLIINGIYLAFRGFLFWQRKVQNPIDKKAEFELMKSKMEDNKKAN